MIREFVARGMGRTELSREVCHLLDWKNKAGELKEMSCRVALKKLEGKGEIVLPEARVLDFTRKKEGGGAGRDRHGVYGIPSGAGRDFPGPGSPGAQGPVPDLEHNDEAAPLSGIWATVRRPDPVSGAKLPDRILGGSLLLVGRLEGGGPGCLDWVESRAAGRGPVLGGGQQPLSDFAACAGSPSGLACSGKGSQDAPRGLGDHHRGTAPSSRDLRGGGTVQGNLLPGGRMG